MVRFPGVCSGDLVEHFPRSERRHARGRQRQALLQLLEHGPIRVLYAVVALDDVVVRLAGEDLRVARIGEPVRVGHPHRAAERPVAGNRAVLRHQLFPEERHQLFTPFRRSGGVEALVRRRCPRAARPWRASSGESPASRPPNISAAPDAVERDEDQRVASGGGLTACGQGRQPGNERNDNDEDPCDHSHLAAESTAMFPGAFAAGDRPIAGGNR